MTREEFKQYVKAGLAYRPMIEAQLQELRERAQAIAEHDPELAQLMRRQAEATQAVYDHIRSRFEAN